MWFAATAVKSGTLQKNRIPDMAIFARNVHISVAWRGGKKMDKLIITLLVVIGVLVLFLGIALEEIKQLQQDKRDWKNRYYAAAQIRAKDRI
jgi:hypothetical protein|nr:MAG TPA: hypothetical protein [Caudoviricetes sp.]